MLQHRLAHDDDDGEDALVQDLLLDGARSGLGGRELVGGDEVDFCAQVPVLRYLSIKADRDS